MSKDKTILKKEVEQIYEQMSLIVMSTLKPFSYKLQI